MTECECVNWCDVRHEVRILTGHHENCRHAGNVLAAACTLIRELAHGMDVWAQDTDGVHPAVWDAYRKAKWMRGEIVHDDTANTDLTGSKQPEKGMP